MKTLADCLKKHGADLDVGYRKDILNLAARNKEAGYPAFESEKFAVGAVLEDLIAERDSIVAQFPKKSPQQQRLDDALKNESGTATVVPATTTAQKALQKVSKLFGLKTVFWESKDPGLRSVNGFMMKEVTDEIYINVSAGMPIAFSVGHETLHQLKNNHKDLYKFLTKNITVSNAEFEAYKAKFREARKGSPEADASDKYIKEELIADFLGDQFQNPEFWSRLNAQNPSMTAKIIDVVLGIINKIKGAVNIEGTQHIKNFDQSLDAIVKAMGEYSKRVSDGEIVTGEADTSIKFSKVTDKKLLNKLESEKKIKVFRAMQIIDGKLYPPMSAKVAGEMRKPTKIGQWEQADENPELAKNGKFKLDKANESAIAARYNPYFHTSASPLNDQFSSAYKRPNLVTVEAEIPASELTSGYQAEGAKDSVGEKQWNSGPVSSKMMAGKKRTVILSRWSKVIRVVPDSEVAANISKMLEGSGLSIPDNVVTPSLREELKKQGVKISESRHTKDIKFSKFTPKREKKSGRYIGAPGWVGSSPQKLGALTRILKQLTFEGEYGRYWYEDSSKAIMKITGGDVAEAEKIVSLIAIYSPNATVSANTTMALTAYYQWKNGHPIKAGFENGNKKAEDLLVRGEMWDGIKTNSFYQNLMVEIDPSKLDPGVATMDMWMAIAFDYGSKRLDQGPKYTFAEGMISNIADTLGWKPHQVQAAIWTAMKSRIDPIRAALKEKELKLGIGETYERDGRQLYRVKKGRDYDHFKLAHKMGMAAEINESDVAAASYNFSNAFAERTAQISWEATPSKDVDDVSFVHTADIETKFKYLTGIQGVLNDENGNDIIAQMAGLPRAPHLFGYSAWEGDIGAGAQDFVPVPWKGAGKNKAVKQDAREVLNLYSDIRGLVLRQDMVVWHIPIYDDIKKRHNGFELRTSRPLTENEMVTLYAEINKKFDTWDLAPGYIENGVRVLNFTDNIDNIEFQKGMDEIMASLPDGFGGEGATTWAGYRSDGEALSNNWKEDKNGEGYTNRINTRRPDLQGRISDLRSRIEAFNKEFTKKYGGVSATGTPKFSKTNQQGSEGAVLRLTHYGRTKGLKELDPNFHGTGLRGAESKRKEADPDHWVNRTYFGLEGYKKEPGLGSEIYTSTVSQDKIYDMAADPDNLQDKIQGVVDAYSGWSPNRLSIYEQLIEKAGYDGYRSGPVVAMFKPTPVSQDQGIKFSKAPPVDSPAFKKWFGKSKVVDENGDPLVVYHGTHSEFTEFDSSKNKNASDHGWLGSDMFYFSEDLSIAKGYSDQNAKTKDPVSFGGDKFPSARVMPVYLSAKKLYRFPKNRSIPINKKESDALREELLSKGYDGVYLPYVFDGEEVTKFNEIAVFHPTQIKSIYNKGTWDGSNPDIRFSKAPPVETKAFKEWFGKSKVVDESGKPLVAYHGAGTKKAINVFESGRSYLLPGSIWFSPKKEYASSYGASGFEGSETGLSVGERKKHVIPVYISAKNPLYGVTDEFKSIQVEHRKGNSGKTFAEFIVSKGYDAYIPFEKPNKPLYKVTEIAVFNPTQIKSATGNSGAFDPANPDIRFSKVGLQKRGDGGKWLSYPTDFDGKVEHIKTIDIGYGKDSPGIKMLNTMDDNTRENKLAELLGIDKNDPNIVLRVHDPGEDDKGLAGRNAANITGSLDFMASMWDEPSKANGMLGMQVSAYKVDMDEFGDYSLMQGGEAVRTERKRPLPAEVVQSLEPYYKKEIQTNKDKIAVSNFEDRLEKLRGTHDRNGTGLLSKYKLDYANSKKFPEVNDSDLKKQLGEGYLKYHGAISDILDENNILKDEDRILGMISYPDKLENYTGRFKKYEDQIKSKLIEVPWIRESLIADIRWPENIEPSKAAAGVKFSKAPAFYSALEKGIEELKQKKAPGSQWLAMINKLPGLKKEEMEWMGLEDWLKDHKGAVNKSSILDFVAANRVDIEEVVSKTQAQSEKEYNNLKDKLDISADKFFGKIRRESAGSLEIDGETIFDDTLYYRLVDDKMSPDVLPVEYRKPAKDWLSAKKEVDQFAENSKLVKTFEPKYASSSYTTPGLEDYKEIVLWSEAAEPMQEDPTHFVEGHEGKRQIAWVRMGTKYVDGKKVLVVDEIQSKRHQEGRKKGYTNQTEIDRLEKRHLKLHSEVFKKGFDPLALLTGKIKDPRVKEMQDISLEINRLEKEAGETPNAPFKKSWPMLAMRKMVRYAAENGFDSIAWTQGEQQADRYDLSKHIRLIDYRDEGNGIFNIKAVKDSNNVLINEKMDLEKIEATFGKEIADKIQNDKGESHARYGGNFSRLEGLDLKVGGEGMKGFYDKILPAEVKKFFGKKAWGNARVGEIEVLKELPADRLGLEKGTFKLHALEITPKMKDKALTEGMPLFSKTQPVNIKEANKPITQSDYDYVIAENSKSVGTRAAEAPSKIWQGIKDVAEDVKDGLDKYMGAVSTRLGNIDPGVKFAIRKLSQQTDKNSMLDAQAVMPMITKAKAKMTKSDHKAWDYARKNSDTDMIYKLIDKYDLRKEYTQYRSVLNKLRSAAHEVGLSIGQIDEYAPRILVDAKGFLRALGQDPDWKIISRRLKERADELGIEVDDMTLEQRAALISDQLHSGNYGMGGVSAAKQRKLSKIPKELDKYYADSDTALLNHVYAMNKAIETRKFFGKIPKKISDIRTKLHNTQAKIREANKNIGGVLSKAQDRELTKLKSNNIKTDAHKKRIKLLESVDTDTMPDELADKFRKKRNALIGLEKQYQLYLDKYAAQRDFSDNIGTYVDKLLIDRDKAGQTPLTGKQQQQLVDILNARFVDKGTHGLWGAYKNLAYIDTMGSPTSAITQIGDLAWAMYEGGILGAVKYAGKSIVGKSRITKEQLGFERIGQEFADPGKLGGALQTVFKWTGLTKMDAIGKEALVNSAFDRYKRDAKKNPDKLRKEIYYQFGGETDQVIQDLLNDKVSENVELLLYNRLLDFQPVALSEMPEIYLKAGNGRIFYMLKSFTLKQFDIFRNEAFKKLASKDIATRAEGIKNLATLASFFVVANAGADEIKDWLLGRDTDPEDRMWDNILRLFGVSKFVTWKARTEGLPSALAKQILPPFKLGDSLYKDAVSVGDGKGLESIGSLPIFGKLAYWRAGRGVSKRGDRWDRQWSKEKKKLNEVKDGLEKSKNKSQYRAEHREEFAKLRKVSSLQGDLNRYRKIINKLKARPETAAINDRIKSLETKRENLIRGYFGRK